MTGFTIEHPDGEEVRDFLLTDEDYAAYALGDLDPPYVDQAIWIGARCGGALEALALHYTGLDPHVLFLMGSHSGIQELLQAEVSPTQVYYTAKPDVESVLRRYFRLVDVFYMARMRLDPSKFRPTAGAALEIAAPVHLTPAQAADIYQLQIETSQLDQREFHEVALAASMVENGYYYGIFVGERLVAVAGTHLVAKHSGIAAVGNVVVHPQQRGQGLGRQVSHAVTKALLEDGFRLIVLNVRQDNLPAIRIYRSLGYEHSGDFIAGLAERR